jgi:hypothetical protein
MGDRISIQFKQGSDKSPVLFSHWGGNHMLDLANEYAEELNKDAIKEGATWPLFRKEVGTVIVDFIRWLCNGKYYKPNERVQSDLCLGVNENDGDNSDNGHHIIDLDKK